MPLTVKCAKCGFVFLAQRGADLPGRFGEQWYSDLYKKYHGVCVCGHALPKPSEFAEKMRLEITANPATLGKSTLVSAFKHDYHSNPYVRIEKRG